MAQNLKDEKLAKCFKIRLDQLGCPFTENVEESWVTELLFKPGEPRIRLLQWLFTRLDERLTDLLDPQFAPGNIKMDSRIQRLLFVASNLGLCSSDDVDLIRGVTSVSKQTAFMTQLLDIVCLPEETEDQLGCISLCDDPHGHETKEMFEKDCEFRDKLAAEIPEDQLRDTEFKVLPPDIRKKIERNRHTTADRTTDRVPTMQDVTDLLTTVKNLTKELEKQNQILQELRDQVEFQPSDFSQTEHLNKSLKLVLCDLSQLVMGFSACFETDIRQWCHKDQPRLTQLGPAFKRVHGLMGKFTTLLSGLGSIRHDHGGVCSTLKNHLENFNTSHYLGKLKSEDTVKMQDCVKILQDSVSRLEHSINTSQDRSLTHNLTVSTIKSDI